METTVRVQASFRLKADLMERLRMGAKASNRSLNNFVESVLLDAMYHEPNDTTKAAIAEARSNKEKKAYNTCRFYCQCQLPLPHLPHAGMPKRSCSSDDAFPRPSVCKVRRPDYDNFQCQRQGHPFQESDDV